MEDLSTMLSGLLNSPDGMEKLKAMAGSLLSQADSTPSQPVASALPDLSAGEIAGLVKMVGLLKSNQNDSRASLLLSIRPHLSSRRQTRVDEAVRILRLISILPAVREAGIL